MYFSIITITRNNLDGLRATTESLSTQSFKTFEWIVVDGDSADGTMEFLHDIPLAGAAAIKASSGPDGGIYDAMNKGLADALGDYILFLNAGDVLAGPDVLRDIAEVGDNADFIYGDAIEGCMIRPARPHHRIAMGMFTHHQAMIYRRALIRDLRFDIAYGIAADYKFTIAFLRRAERITYCPIPVCRFAPGGISQTNPRRGRIEQFRIRREIGVCTLPVNLAIFTGQCVLMTVRRFFPGLYWRLRKAHNSA